MSDVALFAAAAAAAAAALWIGDARAEPRLLLAAAAAAAGTLQAVGYAARDTIDQVQQVMQRARIFGSTILLYALVVLGLVLVAAGGGLEMARLTRGAMLILLGIQLLQAYEPGGRARAMGTVLLLGVLAAAAGGPPAALGVGGASVGLAVFLVLHHHEQMRDVYRMRRAPAPAVQAFWCAVLGGAAAAWCAFWFASLGQMPGCLEAAGLPPIPQRPVTMRELLELTGMLALLAVVCGWGLWWIRRTRQEREEKPTAEREAVPEPAVAAPPPWRAPPPEAGARRRIIHQYLRLLEHLRSRGRRRRPDQTAREFAREAPLEGLAEATELFCAARYTSAPLDEQAVARFEEAARQVRQSG